MSPDDWHTSSKRPQARVGGLSRMCFYHGRRLQVKPRASTIANVCDAQIDTLSAGGYNGAALMSSIYIDMS